MSQITTEAPTKPGAPIERTEHPHIVKSADTLGGEPRIEETRLSVLQIFDMFQGGLTADEIVTEFPFLTQAQIFDAVSYAHDHLDEMHHHRERHDIRTIMRELDWVMVGSRLIPRRRLNLEDVPEGVSVHTWETLPPDND
ncbi:MAG: hypothetical protein QOF01_4565 [Thermomicrobiales bacterium]|nr:hypothetical protein [Thermomicrobiales bacterium]